MKKYLFVVHSVRMWGLWLVMLALMLGGCVRSVAPVVKESQAVTDDSIVGRWISNEGKDKQTIIEVLPAGENKMYRVAYTDHDSKSAQFQGCLGKVGELLIFDYTPEMAEINKKIDDYPRAMLLPLHSFLIVEKTDRDVSLSALSYDWFKDFIKAHPNDLRTQDEVITATTDELQAFILKHYKDKGFLSEPGVFVRESAATQPKTEKRFIR